MNRYSNAIPNTRAIIPRKNPDAPFLVVAPSENGRCEKTGQNPTILSVKTLLSLGGETSPIKAIRAHCVDCCGGSTSEVRKCTAYRCPLWPFRMGKNVFHGRKGARDG